MNGGVLTQKILEDLAGKTGVGVIQGGDGKTATAEELLHRIDHTASQLKRNGVVAGDNVGLLMSPTVQGVADVLAIMTIGSVAVPMTNSAPRSYRDRLEGDAQIRAVLEDGVVARRNPQPRQVPSAPTGTALIAYTSGTTGDPKGIMHTHETLLASCESVIAAWDITPDDRLLHVLPLNHVHGLVIGVLGSLVASAAISFLPRFDEHEVAELAASASLFYGVPTMYSRLVKAGRVDSLRGLRLAVSGSAPLSLELAQILKSAEIPLLERYGMTETCLTLTQSLHEERVPGTVGLPFPGVEVRVSEGELQVRTPALAAGIFGLQGKLTTTSDGWFATGDLVEFGDGGFRIVGRSSNLIISGGYNVQPEAVEEIVWNCPGVIEVLVRGEPDDDLGEVVVAHVVGEPRLTPESVAAHIARHLPHHLRPRRIEMVSELPRNEMGKLRRG